MPGLLADRAARFEHEMRSPDLDLGPADDQAQIDDGVIEEARRRQRRRWRLGLSLAVVAALIAAGLVGSTGTPRQSHPSGARGPVGAVRSTDSATAILARAPDLGVACSTPNSIRCDRIRLAVWLRRPALSVAATIAGTPIQLNDPTWSGPPIHGRRTRFAGLLQPAGMLTGPVKVHPDRGRYWWAGGHPTSVRVQILANYGNGHRASVAVTVLLAAGWG